MRTGQTADYYWLDAISPIEAWTSLESLLEVCPEFVLKKYLVITAWDSGPVKLKGEDFKKGWLKHDRLAINPSVQSVNDIPYIGYDEWYIFQETPLLEPFKVFVNDWIFSLGDPEVPGMEAESAVAGNRGTGDVEKLRELQELFWLQLELKKVETYISSGHRFILATREKELYKRIVKTLSSDNNPAS
jgi:hypothetical protein